jgi:hypothetical protein
MKRITLVLIVLVVVSVIGSLLWYAPNIISQIQNSSSSSSSITDASYTTLFIRSPNYSEPVEFGDTEYFFIYIVGQISINAPFTSDLIQNPKVGTSYEGLGIKLMVANVSSDYISDYVVIKVRPIVENYMFSTYYLTKVDIPIGDVRTVDISSGLINKTNQYTFHYAFAPKPFGSATFVVKTSSLSKQYSAYVGLIVAEAKNDFDIEIRVFKADSNHMVIYVKPLY